jgi:hypothetical protein
MCSTELLACGFESGKKAQPNGAMFVRKIFKCNNNFED